MQNSCNLQSTWKVLTSKLALPPAPRLHWKSNTVKNVAYVAVAQHQQHPPPSLSLIGSRLARNQQRQNSELQKTPLDASHWLNNTNPPAHNTAPLGWGQKVNTAQSGHLLHSHNMDTCMWIYTHATVTHVWHIWGHFLWCWTKYFQYF